MSVKQMTLEDLASRIDPPCSPQALHRTMTVRNPRKATLVKLAKAMGLPLKTLERPEPLAPFKKLGTKARKKRKKYRRKVDNSIYYGRAQK